MNEKKPVPFVEYVKEDKRRYQTAAQAGYYDPDNDFLIGESGGFLFNMNFIFVDTHLLRPAARMFEEFGYYTDKAEDSPPHRRFRVQEEMRRKNGFTAKCKLLYTDIDVYRKLMAESKEADARKLVKPLHITGEHYNFINYGIMSKLDEKSITISKSGKVTAVKTEGIPIFFSSQYWWYKSKQFAKNNGYHIIGGKSRRAGFSYMEAVGSANTINLNKAATVIHAASNLSYLTEGRAITRMALMQLEHYEMNTPFKRGILSRKITDIHLGYKHKDNSNAGYQSHLLSLTTANNPDVAIGKDAIEIKCEELSVFENFDEFVEVTEPTTRTGSITTGLIVGWGTGGSKDAKWEVFERNFYNPGANHFMPFENIWDDDSRNNVCGYFKPYIDCLQGFTKEGIPSMDADGNTNYSIAIQISDEERAEFRLTAKTIHDYLIYCGQYANKPSESFSSTTDNLFASETLTQHINKVRHNPDYKFYTDGMPSNVNGEIRFKSNFKLQDEGVKVHPYIEDVPAKHGVDRFGCMRVWHMPFKDKFGRVPDIYSISYDPVGKDKKDPNNKNSNNSITVWMNPNPYFHNVVKLRVANFYGRPPTMEQADEIARDMCYMYGGHNGMMLAEINRGETKSNFRKWNCIRLLAKAPVEVWDTKVKGKVPDEYGIDLTNDIRKLQGLELLKAMLYRKVGEHDDGTVKVVLETIPDISFLLELQKWNPEGNFDRVSDAIVEAFADKKSELTAKNKMKNKQRAETHVMSREWF
jgi:hypothetical protein